jgi:hypothetical protein
MFGKKFSEYVQFQLWILIMIAVAWGIRLGISLTGTPFSTTRWISVNVVLLIGLLYCSVAVHTSRFGGYKQLLGLLFLQIAFAHLLIAAAIVLGIVTGTDNAYTAPEVFGGNDGKNWLHVFAHFIGAVIVPLFSWLIGSIILFISKRVLPVRHRI